MDNVATQPAPPTVTQPPARPAGDGPAWLFLALEAGLFSTLLGLYAVALSTWMHLNTAEHTAWPPAWGLQLACLILALLSLGLAWAALRRGRARGAMLLLTASVMYGLVLIGSLLMMPMSDEPHVIRITLPSAAPAAMVVTSAPPQTELFTGDVVNGARAFQASCAACHGAQGQGVPNVGLPMVGSPLAALAREADLRRVITQGRTGEDPQSVWNMAMPARGGNPFLSDADITDIIAYVHQLNDSDADSDALAATTPVAPTAPRWVVPPPGTGPAGLRDPLGSQEPAVAGLAAFARTVTQDGPGVMRALALLVMLLLVLHTLVTLGMTLNVLLLQSASPDTGAAIRAAPMVRLYWLALVVAWLIAWPLLQAGNL